VAAKYGRGLGFGQVTSNKLTISPTAMASLTSHVLYQKRSSGPYYVEPLVIGLEPDGWVLSDDEDDYDDDGENESADISIVGDATATTLPPAKRKDRRRRRRCYRPYLCSMDMIGAKSESKAFVCAGAASDSLFGTAEALWKPDLEADELLAVCSKAFLSALERDCLSGYGAVLYLLAPGRGIVEYDIAGRSD